MRVGVTGHQELENPSDWDWVRNELDLVVGQLPPPVSGISSLAAGTDQLFAAIILRHGGALEVVVPFEEYDSTFSEDADRHAYRSLLERASKVDVLTRHGTDEEAYFAAGKTMVDRSDLVVSVWDGKPANGLGGTGDIVAYACERATRLVHLNPVAKKVSVIGD